MKFEGLDAIDWQSLEHAYGPADDIPGLILGLTSTDHKITEKSLWELFGNIHHQGNVYPAAVPAVPFLAEALDYINPEHLPSLLELLGALAEGHGYYDVHQHSQLMTKEMEEMPDSDDVIKGERAVVEQVTLAVFKHWNTYESLLGHNFLSVRVKALDLLTVLANCDQTDASSSDFPVAFLGIRPEGHTKGYWRDRLIHHVEARLKQDILEAEAAVFINTLGEVGHYENLVFAMENTVKFRPFERFIALSNLVKGRYREKETLPDDVAKAIANLIPDFKHIDLGYRQKDLGWDGRAEYHLFSLFAQMSEKDIETHSGQIVELIKKAHNLSSPVSGLLYLALGRRAPDIPAAPCELSPGQKAIATAIVMKPSEMEYFGLWNPANGNPISAFDAFGVTRDRDEWIEWLGLSIKETPVNRPIKQQWWKKFLFSQKTDNS